jgi:amino acid adenylation domain-containing protein
MRGVQVIAEQRILSAWKNVLGADVISPDDNFFEVGGDSVAALRVVNLLAAEGLSISLRDFYLAATPAGQAGRATAAAPPAPEVDEADEDDTARLPLTPLQSVMVVEALRRPEGEAHWLTLAYALPAGTGPEEALAAWRETLRANPALRTRIALDGTGPHQTIGADGPELRIENAGGLDGQELRAWCRDRAAELRGRILSEPLRAYFLAGEPGDHPVLVLLCHHALMDGWSMEQCVGDFHRALAAPGERLPRRPSGAGYQAWLEATGAEAACAAYWRRAMRGAEPAAPLPFERGNGGNAGTAGRGEERDPDPREWHKRLSGAAALGLEDFARAHGLTRAGVLTALWAHLLRQYQDGGDVHVGLTVNNRPAAELPGVAEASGFLLNTLPLRLTPTEDFVADCRRVMAGSAEVAANAHLPYAAVVEAAGLPGMTRLFNTTLIFQNYRRGEEIAGAAQVRQLYAHGTSIDELSLTVDLDEADVRICAAWDAALYDRAAVEALVRDLDYWLAHLDALDPAGIQRGLKTPLDPSHALAGTAADPRPWSVAELLAAGTADGAADATAVVHGETRLSYARLRERAAALAARLAGEHGVGPGDRVALLGDRGAEAAVALCAVWLLGASWCPVSPAWPAERREATLRVLRPAAVVDLATIDLVEAADDAAPLAGYAMPPESVAYHVPTSGSSGAPKLVAVPAGGLGPLVDAWLERYALAGTPQRVLQFGSWTSDVFLGDLLKALATGGTLVICPDDARVDLERVERLLRRWDITLLESTPVMVTAVVRHLARRPGTPPPPALRTLIAGSDTFRLREAEEATALLWDGVRLYNGYGLSECTIESLVQRCRTGMASGSGLVPVGRPLPGTHVDVVDRAGRSLPHGARGELVIAGPQVALGYLTEDGLTGGGRFTEAGDSVRHFRTGDLVRYGPDGRLEFHGRRDGLVKVRGHRVEVGEVEDRLLRLPGVAESFVCLARRDVQDELVAFAGGSGLEERALRDGLRRLLPDHAVPGRVIVERRLPRIGNGKLDRVLMRRRAEETPAAPPVPSGPERTATVGDELTARLVAVWSEVLERPVNPDRSFFDQGGNSILAMRLYARLKELLPAHDVPIGQLFAHPTITAFRASLREPRREEPKGRPTDELALLRALERGELNTAGAMRLLRAGATRRSGGPQ